MAETSRERLPKKVVMVKREILVVAIAVGSYHDSRQWATLIWQISG